MSETDLSTLLAAVRQHLKTETLPKLDGFDAFGVRVAANAVAIAEREIAAQSTLKQLDRELASYAACHPGETPAQAAAKALRDGRLTPKPAFMDLMRRRTMARIAVDNPRYSGLIEAQRRWAAKISE
jgi:hypothetical protein